MSEYSDWRANNSGDEDEDQTDEAPFSGRSALLLLFDCAPYMFENDAASESKFVEFLDIAEAIMRNKVIASENDLIGVVFYNTKNSPAPDAEEDLQSSLVAPRQCAIFLPLTTITVDMIRLIRDMRASKDHFQFETKYGHSEGTSLANVLWLCSRIFSHCGYKLEHSTIVLFTGNDQPHKSNSNEYQQALVKARDLMQKDIAVALVPMVDDFDCKKFYKEFLCTVLEEDMEEFVAPVYQQSKEQLLRRIFSRDFKKRALAHLKWHISADLALGVNIYSLSRKPRFPKKVKLLKSTNEIVVSKRAYVSTTFQEENEEEESKPLLPGEQRRSITIGGETVYFKPEEISHMKQMLPPGIRLLGFKPAAKILITNHLRSSLFIYPNESRINGSTTLFRALYEKCLERGQVAYCILTLRRKCPPRLVALVPQELARDADGEIFRPSGFRVEFVPYAADIRNLPMLEETTPPEVTEDQTNLFKSVIKKIKFKFSPANFENPASMNLFLNVESLLFEKDEVDLIDSTRPDCDRIDSKMEALLNDMQHLFGEDEAEAPKRTRKDPNENESRAKTARSGPGNDDELVEMAKSRQTTSLTVALLKEYLQRKGVSGLSKKTKADLIEQVLQINQSS